VSPAHAPDYKHRYALYGLTIESNREIPGLPPAREDGSPVVIDFAGPSHGDPEAQPFWTTGRETLWHIDAATWLLAYRWPEIDRYRWTLRYDGCERVTVGWDTDAIACDIPAVLQGPGIAASLHLRGVPILHGCVIDIGGRAIILMGEPGAGKSTTAAALVRSGFPLVSDDLAAISFREAEVFVHAGYPRLRLFADSAAAAGWDPSRLSRTFVTPLIGDKRCIDLSAGSFTAGPLPVSAIYVFQPRRASGGDPVVTAIDRRAAWGVLARNIYSLRFLDPARRFRAVRDCAVIAARVPLRSVEAADGLDELPRLVDALAGDARAVNA
jgi:hypothetical protein